MSEPLSDHARRLRAADAERTRLNEAALAASPSPDAARLLLRVMEDISEDHYCAGWMTGLERALWGMVVGERSRDYGMGEVTEEEVADMRDLATRANGWWYFDDALFGERFVPLATWREMYARGIGLCPTDGPSAVTEARRPSGERA